MDPAAAACREDGLSTIPTMQEDGSDHSEMSFCHTLAAAAAAAARVAPCTTALGTSILAQPAATHAQCLLLQLAFLY